VKRGEDGRRYVFLDTGTDEATIHEPGALISEMRERIGLLERELEEAHAANRENRRIIAALTSRIPELPAPSSPDERESSETVAHQMPMGAEPSEAREEAQEVAQPRSWWRRVFGG